jgi:hypothetical protein
MFAWLPDLTVVAEAKARTDRDPRLASAPRDVLAYAPWRQLVGRRAESVRPRCRRLPMLLSRSKSL